jgi:aspartyl-tRNA(Asn)/glutamyl-tRNA(Gln) amidotransferase subunit C
MAKLSREDILKLARLSRLQLTDEEIERYTDEIGVILTYVEQLKKIDLADIEPTHQVTGLTNVMRPDVDSGYGVDAADLLKNTPATEDGHIKVKRMLA